MNYFRTNDGRRVYEAEYTLPDATEPLHYLYLIHPSGYQHCHAPSKYAWWFSFKLCLRKFCHCCCCDADDYSPTVPGTQNRQLRYRQDTDNISSSENVFFTIQNHSIKSLELWLYSYLGSFTGFAHLLKRASRYLDFRRRSRSLKYAVRETVNAAVYSNLLRIIKDIKIHHNCSANFAV